MKKLLYIILLLPLWVNAQTNGTIQKTSATGTIRGSFGSLGIDTLVNVNAPTNGYVPVYNSTLKKSVWTNPSTFSPTLGTSAISLGGTANGLSYSAGNYRLHKVTETTGGVMTTGADTIAGAKTFTGNLTLSANSPSLIGSQATAVGNMSIGTQNSNALILLTDNTNRLNISNNGTVSLSSLSAGGIVKASGVQGALGIATAGTDYLTPTGSGSGLSGVVLTSTNQTGIAGNKEWTGYHTFTSGSGISIGDGTNVGLLRLNRGGTGSTGYVLWQTAGIDKWTSGFRTGDDDYHIYNVTGTGTDAFKISNSTNAISAVGSISSTPQGTLYGTASGSITSAQLATSLTDETGTGSAVFSASPTFTGTVAMAALTGTSATFSASLPLTITSSSGQTIKSIAADATGDNYFSFYRSNGSTLKGLIGFSTSSTDIFRITNAENDGMEFGTNNITRYTIDASGNNTWTGIGEFGSVIRVAGQNVAFHSAGLTYYYGGTNGQTFVNSAGTIEFGRFTSGGFFKASNNGTYVSTSGAYHELRSDQGDWIAQIINTHGSNPYGVYVKHSVSTNGAANYLYRGDDGANFRFGVSSNGGISNYSANNVNLSDERAKKNIVKAGSYWNIVKAIEFDSYKYKDQKDNRKLLGVMAQQVESIYPEWVSNSGSFGKATDGTNYKSVYEQQLQYGVNIVVQESMKRIEALEAEVKILKSK